MKKTIKLIALVLVLVLICAFACGCGEDKKVKDVDVDTVFDTIYDNCKAQSDNVSDLFMIDSLEEMANWGYDGIAELEADSFKYGQPYVFGAGMEIAVVKAKSAADCEKIAEIFKNRIAIGSDDDFYPDNAATWKNNSAVYTCGNTAILVCMPEDVELPEKAIEDLYK